MYIYLKMGSCCLIIHGIALILVVRLCSSFLLSDLNCLVCDEVHDLADCKFSDRRCSAYQACYLEVRGDQTYQRIKAGCGSVPSHCHNHHDKRSDHDFCDYPVLCNGDCRDSDSCNEYICNLPLYGHYEPTTTVKPTTMKTIVKTVPTTTETTTATTTIMSSTKQQTTTSGTTKQVSTTKTLPTSLTFGSSTNSVVSTTTASTPTDTVTTATSPSPKQPTSTSGTTTQTVTTSSTFGSSTNSAISTTTASTPTDTVTTATSPSPKQPTSTSGTQTVTTSPTNNGVTTNATVPQTTKRTTGVSCATCSGPMCGYSPIQPVVQCPGDAPYCMNSVENHLDASKTITKACATVEECKTKWWHQTSDRSECTGLNVAVPVNDDFTCHFCCVKDNCNKPVVPALDSLFRG